MFYKKMFIMKRGYITMTRYINIIQSTNNSDRFILNYFYILSVQ